MKASDLIKKSIEIEDVYKAIEDMNKVGQYKHGIPDMMYVSNEVQVKLIANGFKLYRGDLDYMKNALIIEW